MKLEFQIIQYTTNIGVIFALTLKITSRVPHFVQERMSMRNILAILLLMSLSPGASALVITQSLVRTGQTVEYLSGSPLGKFGGAFQQFNPALGTLDSVDLSFTGDLTYYANYQRELPQCAQFCYAAVAFSTGYIFNAPGFPTSSETSSDFFALLNWAQYVSFNSTTGLYSYNTYSGYWSSTTSPNLINATSGPMPISYSANPFNLSGYIGVGNVTVSGAISEDSDICEGNYGLVPSCSDYLNLTSTLTYTYTPTVSEPPELPIFATGLICFLVLIWRRERGK